VVFDPKKTWQERFPPYPISTGLLQISSESARGHHSFCRNTFKRSHCNCASATTALLKNPTYNLRCGITILENQTEFYAEYLRTGDTRFETSQEHQSPKGCGNHFYWAVLNPDHDPNGHKRLDTHLAKLEMPRACR
jgi:hypothetical protein